ncbi:MAG: VCBS repeat-containing protein, partial [Bacteroidota bacterium]
GAEAMQAMRTSTSRQALQALQAMRTSTSRQALQAGRVLPGKYPMAPRSYLFENVGRGEMYDSTSAVAPGLENIGLVTDAVWTDIDGDKDDDLVVVGEWMAVSVFRNDDGKLVEMTEAAGLANSSGWWYNVEAGDVDGDGDMDLVVGNLGLNSKYPASETEPLNIWVHDFDENGSQDIVLGYHQQGQCFPVRGRTCSSEQMPFLQQKFPTYQEFGTATIEQVYGDALESAYHRDAKTLASTVFLNDGQGRFTARPLPNDAQLSPGNALALRDFNGDGHLDLLLAGNMHHTEVETSRADAGFGCYLEGDGTGNFRPVSLEESGFFVPGDVKDLAVVERPGKNPVVFVTVNDGYLQCWEFRREAL